MFKTYERERPSVFPGIDSFLWLQLATISSPHIKRLLFLEIHKYTDKCLVSLYFKYVVVAEWSYFCNEHLFHRTLRDCSSFTLPINEESLGCYKTVI